MITANGKAVSGTPAPLHGVRRVAFAGIVLGALGIAAAYLSAFAPPSIAAAGPWLMAVALPVCLVAVMTFGAVRDGRTLGAMAIPFTMVLVLVMGGFLLALMMPADVVGDRLWFGLPRRAAVILFGVGLLPLFVLPLVYALTFDALTLSDDDVARVRAARVGGADAAGHAMSAESADAAPRPPEAS